MADNQTRQESHQRMNSTPNEKPNYNHPGFVIGLGIFLLVLALFYVDYTEWLVTKICMILIGMGCVLQGILMNKKKGSSSKKTSGFGDLWQSANNLLTWVGGLVFLITEFFLGNFLFLWYKTGSFSGSPQKQYTVYTPTVPVGAKKNIDLVYGDNIISPKGTRYLRDKTWDIFFELKQKNTSAILTFVNEENPQVRWRVRIKNVQGTTTFDLLDEAIPGNTGVYTVSADRPITCNVYW